MGSYALFVHIAPYYSFNNRNYARYERCLKIKTTGVDVRFAVIEQIYSNEEINSILNAIRNADTSKATFRKTTGLFAIRQFLREIPKVLVIILMDNLKKIIRDIIGDNFFVVRAFILINLKIRIGMCFIIKI